MTKNTKMWMAFALTMLLYLISKFVFHMVGN